MAARITYSQESARSNTVLLREALMELPAYCGEFFRGIDETTMPLTRLNYAYDIRTFLTFLSTEHRAFRGKPITGITLADLDTISITDIEVYSEYLSLYDKNERVMENGESGKERKLCALRTFYSYFCKKGALKSNAVSLVDLPKKHRKAIIYLEPHEVARLLDDVEAGTQMTDHQKSYHDQTKLRDLAMLTLFLTTGVRVSECVGLDIEDIDLENATILVTRKGGDQAILYLSDEAVGVIKEYLKQRLQVDALTGHEHALFLSMQRKRIGVRAVENLVKKYAERAAPLKRISPHKLRSTYGTSLYRETGDIYLVAEVLGHSDVNTTKKHYAAMDLELRRRAANAVKLRED